VLVLARCLQRFDLRSVVPEDHVMPLTEEIASAALRRRN
jgi:hypothetical protein